MLVVKPSINKPAPIVATILVKLLPYIVNAKLLIKIYIIKVKNNLYGNYNFLII